MLQTQEKLLQHWAPALDFDEHPLGGVEHPTPQIHLRGQSINKGAVQGVGFRWSVLAEALRLGASGWVRNLPDGRVEAFVQGDSDTVAAVVSFVRTGPPGSRVVSCTETEAGLDERYSSFEIRV